MNNFSKTKVYWRTCSHYLLEKRILIVARWLVKYINRIFSGFAFHICVANRIQIRIRIPTSWIRTGVGLDLKTLSPNTSATFSVWGICPLPLPRLNGDLCLMARRWLEVDVVPFCSVILSRDVVLNCPVDFCYSSLFIFSLLVLFRCVEVQLIKT